MVRAPDHPRAGKSLCVAIKRVAPTHPAASPRASRTPFGLLVLQPLLIDEESVRWKDDPAGGPLLTRS
jgi:hypothetical protein